MLKTPPEERNLDATQESPKVDERRSNQATRLEASVDESAQSDERQTNQA